jgi:quercetin 2,3-dioxygenase
MCLPDASKEHPMPTIRRIRKVIHSKPTIEGAGVHLKRAFGFAEAPGLDPFLLLDDIRPDRPEDYVKGFPWHPHRGIETITYVLRGQVAHGDSLGNRGVIGPGDVQWMTAGSGIIHFEMPDGDADGRVSGFQLWANLPASHKMMDPRYRSIDQTDIPLVTLPDGVAVRVICGQVHGTAGPAQDIMIEPEYVDVTVPPATEYAHPTRPGHTVLVYVIEGSASFCHETDPFRYETEGASYFDLDRTARLGDGSLIVFEDGDAIIASTADESVRFLLMAGRPLHEPVAWYGPIVMNTRAELQAAFEEYRRGTFIKKGVG